MTIHIFGLSPTAYHPQASAGSCVAACIGAIAIVGLSGCHEALGPVLTQLMEARRLVADLRVQFTTGADASNRAVMAYSDEGAGTAAREAQTAMHAVQRDVLALQPILQQLAYAEEGRQLEEFEKRFAEDPDAGQHHSRAGRREHQPQGAAALLRSRPGSGRGRPRFARAGRAFQPAEGRVSGGGARRPGRGGGERNPGACRRRTSPRRTTPPCRGWSSRWRTRKRPPEARSPA